MALFSAGPRSGGMSFMSSYLGVAVCIFVVFTLYISLISRAKDPIYMPDFEKTTPATGWSPPSRLCSYRSEDELARFIWAHRGHDEVDEHAIDSSKATLGKLLDAGLTNFDVDVVIYHGDDRSTKYKKGGEYFLVQHPVPFKKYSEEPSKLNIDSLQTLDEFLRQVEEHPNIQRVYRSQEHLASHAMVVSLEPKFYDPQLIKKMVLITQSTEFRRKHSAIIAISHDLLGAIEEGYAAYPRLSAHRARTSSGMSTGNDHGAMDNILREVGTPSEEETLPALSLVGISIRTEPKPEAPEQAMLQWDPRPGWFLDASKPPVHEHGKLKGRKEEKGGTLGLKAVDIGNDGLVGSGRSSTSRISGIPFGGGCDDCCTVVPQYTTDNSQIVFIDNKLLKKTVQVTRQEQQQQNSRGEGFHSVCERRGTHVVSWVVDDEALMWDMLEAGVVGVITNRPLALLRALKERYVEVCKSTIAALSER